MGWAGDVFEQRVLSSAPSTFKAVAGRRWEALPAGKRTEVEGNGLEELVGQTSDVEGGLKL